MSPTRLNCTVCGVEIVLSENTAVMLAEVEAFSAAHSTHSEGVGVHSDTESDDKTA